MPAPESEMTEVAIELLCGLSKDYDRNDIHYVAGVLAAAHAKGMEEAAQIADGWDFGKIIAEEIRDRINQGTGE